MARGVAKCTCKTCGEIFEKIKYDCGNSRDARNWEQWAEATFDTCPECYKEEQTRKAHEEAKAKGLPELTDGSEKQIAWAEKIRKAMIKSIDEEIKIYEEDLKAGYEPNRTFTLDDLKTIKKHYESLDSARTFIDYGNDFIFSRDLFKEILKKEAEKEAGYEEIEVQYSLYKNKLYSMNTKKDSYDEETNTIVLQVSKLDTKSIEKVNLRLAEYNAGDEEIEVPYRIYKNNLSNFRTKKDSYDSYSKTIIVLVCSLYPETIEKINLLLQKDEDKKKFDKDHTIRIDFYDLKQGTFKDRISYQISNSYEDSDKTVSVVVKSDEDLTFIKEYYEEHAKEIEKKKKRAAFMKEEIAEYTITPEVLSVDDVSDDVPEELINGGAA